jgi:hypothetical protein
MRREAPGRLTDRVLLSSLTSSTNYPEAARTAPGVATELLSIARGRQCRRHLDFPGWTAIMNPASVTRLPAAASVSRGSAAPASLDVDASTWWALASTATDALVVGDRPAILHVLTCAWPMLQKPRFWCEGRRLGLVSAFRGGTLILENVLGLDSGGQERLLEWCRTRDAKPRIIATATPELQTLLDTGAFSRPLYEQLRAGLLVVA